MTRFIFITGGVTSSLGKGLAAAALAATLQARGYKVRLRKLDPYLNVDPGTMSPIQHGEVFVTDDGAETDLDLGHYERFTGVAAKATDNATAGRIYRAVLERERRGDYLGATVQVVPHVTDEIKAFVRADLDDEDFCVCEIGGTVGDIESLPFLEAMRQLINELGVDQAMAVHVTLLPYIAAAGELKTKPTQHSVKELLSVGVQPDLLLCRADRPIPESERRKIALFCNVPSNNVIAALDAPNIYQVPLDYSAQGMDAQVCRHFGLPHSPAPDLSRWRDIVTRISKARAEVTIAVICKYAAMPDAYMSLSEALNHGGIFNDVQVKHEWLDCELFEHEAAAPHLAGAHAILVPGGFGRRGTEGMVAVARFARENKIPYFGVCFGMHMAIIECARHLVGLEGASSSEFGPCQHPLIGLMTEWLDREQGMRISPSFDMGGTMRLGTFDCVLRPGSKVCDIYGTDVIRERHRHRYEVNAAYQERLEKAGLLFSGISSDGGRAEVVEYINHPWFIGVQFHPELRSRPFSPHPLFSSFVAAAARARLASQGGPVGAGAA